MQILSKERFKQLTDSFEKLAPIVVVGDIGIDKYTFGEVKRISPEAPVPVVEVTKEWHKLGLAANISHNLKTLGIESTLTGVIGEDTKATTFENLLEECGLSTWGMVRSKGRPTIFKERVITATQQVCRIDYESLGPVDEEIQKRLLDRIKDFSQAHEAIIIEDYSKGTLTKEVLAGLIQLFNEQGKLVAVDPGRGTPPLYYKGAGLLKPNLAESQIMASALGHHNEKRLEIISEILMDKLELQRLVITLGPEGMLLLDRNSRTGPHIIPTVATEVFDVSGAGDTAIALLTASIMAGASLEEAAWIGNCGSGVVVGKKGTATVDLKELRDFHDRLLKKFCP